MSERKNLIGQIRDAGQAIVAVSMVTGILGGVAVKAWGVMTAGVEAKNQVASVTVEVTTMKRQMKFLMWAAEKQTKITFREWSRERYRRDEETTE